MHWGGGRILPGRIGSQVIVLGVDEYLHVHHRGPRSDMDGDVGDIGPLGATSDTWMATWATLMCVYARERF